MPAKHTYIKNIHLSGYKSIKDIACNFDPGLNIIIGNNGSGKSNLLEFIYKVLKRDYIGLDVFKAEIKFNVGKTGFNAKKDEIHNDEFIWVTEGKITNRREAFERQDITVNAPQHNAAYIEFARFNLPKEIPILSHEYNPKYDFKAKRYLIEEEEVFIPRVLTNWLSGKFIDDNLSELKSIDELTDGRLYSSLDESFKLYFEDVKRRLVRYTPIEDIRISSSVRVSKIDSSSTELRNILLEYKLNGNWFGWKALSDGTQRLIYLIFIINGLEYSNDVFKISWDKFVPITFIEEPELGIHPHQLHLLMNFLKESAQEQQIILTTHSPQVLDILESNELNKIIIAEIDYDNGTILRHLTPEETQKAQAYFKDQGLLSDYWRFSDLQRSKLSK